ncbi:hypothetical protein [Gluconacetobacter sacchari]|uniref:Uncharacterized protein n=2 Tax=Gluconacetobacter sacchari TaxID=92759 RepID=A0A7W4IC28_9PROT|nr:hypothetical protein [Gluconacetobacter sacchari]MBB2160103.1 hypothetical protein [Gluconacetobacter sacchari]
MAIDWKSILGSAFAVVNGVAGASAAGKLSTYNTVAQTAIKAAVTKVDGGVDQLKTAFDTFETANPLVAQALTEFSTLATTLGLTLPTEDGIVTHIKAAIADLQGMFVPDTSTASAGTTTPAA